MHNKPGLFLLVLAGLQIGLLTACQSGTPGRPAQSARIANDALAITWPAASVASWRYTIRPGGDSLAITLPVFEIDGRQTPMVLRHLAMVGQPTPLRNGAVEYACEGSLESDETLRLRVTFRMAPDSPVVRFRYTLVSAAGHTLTKTAGKDALAYASYSLKDYPVRTEIRLAVFNEMIHACNLSEVSLVPADFAHSACITGPILLGNNGKSTILCAYEHDSMYTDAFLEYRLQPGENVTLNAIRGNYHEGQTADGYTSIWFEVGGVAGSETDLAGRYRTFALKYLSENTASRKPYIYYNTWGRQERVKWAGGQYLDTMNLEYTLREIDRAHEMGIDAYVLDAGWFDRTGDWGVNSKNYPDGFARIREKINGFGMRLGVWMNPEKAAISSRALQQNIACLKTRDGKAAPPAPEWETEDSTNMCLVSPYWETYADVLIRLYNELGIRGFYWDGVGQSGCDDPRHFHGTAQNSAEERQACFGFLLPVYLGKIAGKVGEVCPDAVFDFDVTESRRIGVGLEFLASGRYFMLNNGPYFHNLDLCPHGESILPNGCRNVFIHPGPARTWFMRTVLDYDRWLPSNLFMANYQPDDPASSQLINLASLVLGQNAVWGEILKTSPEGVKLFHDILARYKQVRNDVALASPVHIGNSGDTPEIFEKINPATGKGVVAIFANTRGDFTYVTRHAVAASVWYNEGVTSQAGADGHAEITAAFTEPSAKIVFFGVTPQ